MAASDLSAQQVRAEQARLARRVLSYAKHRDALEQAIRDLDENLDRVVWRDAFDATDPELTNKVLAVTAGYSTLLNNYVEIVRTSARLAGLMQGRRPNVEQCLQKLSEARAITDAEAGAINELYAIEGRMEHLSPDLSADEVREAVIRLRDQLPGLMEKAVRWLRGQGIAVG